MIGIGGGRGSKRVTILYNLLERLEYGELRDLEAEKSIIEEVRAVETSVLELGYECSVIALKNDIFPVIGWLKKIKPHVVVNLCESVYGDSCLEMAIPSLLDLTRIPYTGNSALALGLCQDKGRTKDLLRAHNLLTPEYAIADCALPVKRILFDPPWVIKPIHEDGSLGITSKSVVYGQGNLEEQIHYVIENYKQPALVEQYILGREFQALVMDINGEPKALPVSEIVYSDWPILIPKICDFKAKWDYGSPEEKGSIPVCPADISRTISEELQFIGIKVYRLLGCTGYARIDFRMDKNEKIYVLEVNPNQDISPTSGAFNTLRAAGFTYTSFIKTLIDGVLNRDGR